MYICTWGGFWSSDMQMCYCDIIFEKTVFLFTEPSSSSLQTPMSWLWILGEHSKINNKSHFGICLIHANISFSASCENNRTAVIRITAHPKTPAFNTHLQSVQTNSVKTLKTDTQSTWVYIKNNISYSHSKQQTWINLGTLFFFFLSAEALKQINI